MACTMNYDFIGDIRIQLPEIAHATPTLREATGDRPDGLHGMRAILAPDAAARALLNDHIRTLAALHG